jgi:hypothetical protein
MVAMMVGRQGHQTYLSKGTPLRMIQAVVSEEKIFEKVYRRTPSDGNSSHDPLGQVS